MPPLISVPCWQGLSYGFDPARAAFLAIDMQRDFLVESGICAQAGEDPELGSARVGVSEIGVRS